MERDNFYIILDLSVDPPEMDATKIEEAIKKKQTEWSRLRNHPTRGIKAQRYIGMISEIRDVMMNPTLREMEAKVALEIIRKREKTKFSNIDRHLELLMSKGFVKEEEIFKLAKYHKVNVFEIRNRIALKEKEKYSGLDKQILNRMKKGYITEAEITTLSKINGIDENTIRKRITCPIKKEKNTRYKKANPLDTSLHAVIEENLKIVKKTSLYDFLELPPDSEIKDLQQRAKEKESEVLNIRKKDAIATASGVLVGHCISLFKNEKNKASYDATQAQVHLSELNADIDVAAIEGIIRIENVTFLVERAVELGLSPEEALDHINKYCKTKNWSIETSSKKSARIRKYLVPIAAIIIFLTAGTYFGFYIYNYYKYKSEYEKIMTMSESQDKLEDKMDVLKNYLSSHSRHGYTEMIKKKYEEYADQINSGEYDAMINAADEFIFQEKPDEAMELYQQFLLKNPNSPNKADINAKISRLSKTIEDRDFKALETHLSIEAVDRIAAYRQYLEKHPDGKHVNDVLLLLSKLGDAYYVTLKDELARCENERTYEKCIQLAETFIRFYPNDSKSGELKTIQDQYRQKLRNEMVMAELRKRSQEKGADFEAAKQIFIRYLRLNPNSPLENRIQIELSQLEEAEKDAKARETHERNIELLKAAKGRFVMTKENIITDTRTNLMWTMWDSAYSTVNCMDYENAQEYVTGLRTGGYGDWRIPTPKELTGLYKTEPFLTLSNAEWYWTSLSFRSYRDGWIQMVDVITGDNKNHQRKQIDSRHCGAVIAVRP